MAVYEKRAMTRMASFEVPIVPNIPLPGRHIEYDEGCIVNNGVSYLGGVCISFQSTNRGTKITLSVPSDWHNEHPIVSEKMVNRTLKNMAIELRTKEIRFCDDEICKYTAA